MTDVGIASKERRFKNTIRKNDHYWKEPTLDSIKPNYISAAMNEDCYTVMVQWVANTNSYNNKL